MFWRPSSVGEIEAGPCKGGCSPTECLKEGAYGIVSGDEGYYCPWECSHGTWLMPSAGSCCQRRTPTEDTAALIACAENLMLLNLRGRVDLTFGEIAYQEDLEYYAAEGPERRAARLEAMEAYAVKEVHGQMLCRVKRKEEKWARAPRICAPCRYASLLMQRTCASCMAKVPLGQTACSSLVVREEEQQRRHDGRLVGTGKMVVRVAKEGDLGVKPCGEVLAGCWNHQHGTCIYVHPEERQWADALAGRMPRKLSSQEFANWGMVPVAPVVPNRFANLGGGQRGPQRGPQRGW